MCTCGHGYHDHEPKQPGFKHGPCVVEHCPCMKFFYSNVRCDCGHGPASHHAYTNCRVMDCPCTQWTNEPLRIALELHERRVRRQERQKGSEDPINPRCDNCQHPWRSHFVHDLDSRCSLGQRPGITKHCACGGFRSEQFPETDPANRLLYPSALRRTQPLYPPRPPKPVNIKLVTHNGTTSVNASRLSTSKPW